MYFRGLKIETNRIILKIKNKTDRRIEEILFSSDQKENIVRAKRIDIDSEKKISIANYDKVTGLKMTVAGCEKTYIIKEKVEPRKRLEISIIINTWNKQECDFSIKY